MIKFLGLESGFGDYHTNAFFKTDKSLVYIDLSGTSMKKAKRLLEENLDKEIFMLVTHLHADHISGIPIFIQTAFYVYHKTINFVIPTNIKDDFKNYLKITGINPSIYNVNYVDDLKEVSFVDFKVTPISTFHCEELINKCFGYLIEVNERKYLYTGDTAILEPFKPFLNNLESLYIDTSVDYGKVHLRLDEILDYFGDSPSFNIYLMHLDNVGKAFSIIKDKKNYFLGEVID